MFYQVYNKMTQERTIQSLSKLGSFLSEQKKQFYHVVDLFFLLDQKIDELPHESHLIFKNSKFNLDILNCFFQYTNIQNLIKNIDPFCSSEKQYFSLLNTIFFHFINDNFEIFDEHGNKISHYQKIIELYEEVRKNKRQKTKYWHRSKKGRFFRNIKTFNERRQNAYVDYDELEPPIRGARRCLPDSWWDINSVVSACWKDQSKRKRQYKSY